MRKPQMMRIGRLAATDQARLRSDKLQMILVPNPLGFGVVVRRKPDLGVFLIIQS